MTMGALCTPAFASVEYAEAISSGVHPTEPNATDGNLGSFVSMPIRDAVRVTLRVPTPHATRAKTAFTECQVASSSGIMP